MSLHFSRNLQPVWFVIGVFISFCWFHWILFHFIFRRCCFFFISSILFDCSNNFNSKQEKQCSFNILKANRIGIYICSTAIEMNWGLLLIFLLYTHLFMIFHRKCLMPYCIARECVCVLFKNIHCVVIFDIFLQKKIKAISFNEFWIKSVISIIRDKFLEQKKNWYQTKQKEPQTKLTKYSSNLRFLIVCWYYWPRDVKACAKTNIFSNFEINLILIIVLVWL